MADSPPNVTRYEAEEGSGSSSDFDLAGSFEPSLTLPCQLGEYRVLELIGTGGMGQVYRAEHIRMARPVALKTLRPELIRNSLAVDRFYAEVRAAARVIHPNLVVAFDAGEAAQVHFLAMELVNGETLAQVVSQAGPLGEADAVRMVRQAALGLHAAHRAGIVHRDVKPSNLMRLPDGDIKVLDLGLATITSEIESGTGRGRLVGTIEFIAPEQLLHPDAVDPRADIYSLGATLFYLLVGRSPFAGSLIEQARAHRDEPPPEIYRFRHDADLRLDHIVRRMLAKRPEQRYQDMVEVAAELEPLLNTVSKERPLRDTASLTTDLGSTAQSLSTSTSAPSLLGIDLGLYYCAASFAEAGGKVRSVAAGGEGRPLLRCAVASDQGRILVGEEAIRLRAEAPERVTHCIQVYLGRALVDRQLNGQLLPPEGWLGLVLARLQQSVRSSPGRKRNRAEGFAISVPACYDQLHRRAILHAATIAGLKAPRLVDRPLAAATSQMNHALATLPVPDPAQVCHWLVVSIAGSATEVAAVRHLGGRLQMLATAGSWTAGVPAWHQRLVDLVATDCKRKIGNDPRLNLKAAVALQMACEQGLRGLLLSEKSEVRFAFDRRQVAVTLTRDAVKAACHDLLAQLEAMVQEVIGAADLTPDQFERCLLLGSMARLPLNVEALKRQLTPRVVFQPIDQSSVASGTALAAGSSLLLGNEEVTSIGCTARDLGVLVRNEHEGRRTVTVVPRFTALPARSMRRLRWASETSSDEIAIVESASWQGASWRSLGTHRPSIAFTGGLGELTFSVNESGVLDVQLRDPSTGRAETIGPLPAPHLAPADLERWRAWVEESLMVSV